MPSPLSFLHRPDPLAATVASDTPCSSSSTTALKLQRFGERLMNRPPGGKPVDFADLARLHGAWKAAGNAGSDDTARTIHELATRYLEWAEQQQEKRHERQRPASDRLSDHRRHAAAMVAQTQEFQATRAPRSRSPSPSAGFPGSSPSIRSSRRRLGDAAGAAVKSFRQQFSPPKPGSFKELKSAYAALTEKPDIRALDKAEALQVLRLGQRYLERHPETASEKPVGRARRELAALFVQAIQQTIERDRLRSQLGIDTAHTQLHSPDLLVRTVDRQKHAAAMIRQLPSAQRAHDGTSERFISRGDGTRMYRFIPMPTRHAVGHEDIGPQHAVLASVLHRKLVEQVGLDLRFPCATTAMIEGAVGVLVDSVDLPEPRLAGCSYARAELQRAVLAQWVLGRPRATWSGVGVDDQGQLRARHPPLEGFSPAAIAREGLRGVSPMINVDPPIEELHGPVDRELAVPLLRLDLDALAKEIRDAQDAIDVSTLCNGLRARQAPRSQMASHKDAVDRLLEPLRALQKALKESEKRPLPLAMVLADAAEHLSQVSYP